MIFKTITPPQSSIKGGIMTSDKDIIEITIGKDGKYEVHLDVDDKTEFIIKDITDVKFFNPAKQEWIDIGYKGPVSLNYKGEDE